MNYSTRAPNKERIRFLFFISIFLVLLVSLLGITRVSFPFGLSYLIYLICFPLILKFEKFGFSRSTSVFLVFTGILFFSTFPIIKAVPIITEEAQNVQFYIPKVEKFIRTKYTEVKFKIEESFGVALEKDALDDGLSYLRNAITSFILTLPNIFRSVVEWIFLVPLFVFFLLKDGQKIKYIFLKTVPNFLFERIYYIGHQFHKELGGYILAKVFEATFVGAIITIGLTVLDVKFALLLGIVAGVTNIIPYLGPIFGMAPGVIYALAEYGTGTNFGAVVLLYVIANFIDLAIIFPVLVSKMVNLHPVLVVISVMLGGQYLGIVGMIISIPVAAVIKLLVNEIYTEFYGSKAS